jgi:hypothetical protein
LGRLRRPSVQVAQYQYLQDQMFPVSTSLSDFSSGTSNLKAPDKMGVWRLRSLLCVSEKFQCAIVEIGIADINMLYTFTKFVTITALE